MVNLEIPEELDAVLQSAAARAGRTRDELAQEILAVHLDEEHASTVELSEQQLSRLKQSVGQVRRGEVVDGEIILSKLDSLIDVLEARERKAS